MVTTDEHPPRAPQADGPVVPSRRVLLVAEAFGGGLFEITRHLAEGLVERGHHATIAYGIRPETPSDPRKVIDERVELIPMPWADRGLRAQARGLRAMRGVVTRHRPDVVHLLSSFAGFHGAVALGRNVPTVYTPQGYAFTMGSESRLRRAIFHALEFFVARRVSVIGACSQTEARQAQRQLRAPRVAVVENGIAELNAPRGRATTNGARLVVGLGRPSPQRQPEACARILSSVRDLAEVRWIGGGPDSAGLNALKAAGIPVSGWLSHRQTQESLAAADVYLHWTAWDGLALSLLEALASDVLIVASDIGPNREVLGREQVCATEEEATTLIRSVLSDPQLRERLLDEQRRRRGRYGSEAMVERWISLYDTLIAGVGTRPAKLGNSSASGRAHTARERSSVSST